MKIHFFVWAHAPCLCTSMNCSMHKNMLNLFCTRYFAVFRAFLSVTTFVCQVWLHWCFLWNWCVCDRGVSGGSGFAYIVDIEWTEITYTVGKSQHFPWEKTGYEYKNNKSKESPHHDRKAMCGEIKPTMYILFHKTFSFWVTFMIWVENSL